MPAIGTPPVSRFVGALLHKYILLEAYRYDHRRQPCLEGMQVEARWTPGPDPGAAQVVVQHGEHVWGTQITVHGRVPSDVLVELAARVVRWHDEDIHKFDSAGS